MPDRHDDFQPRDIPHNVVIQDALTPHLGGFEQARQAAEAASHALAVTYRRTVVDAQELAHQENELRRLRAQVARVRADCEEQTAKPHTDDIRRGIWAQARRILNLLGPAEAPESDSEPVQASGH